MTQKSGELPIACRLSDREFRRRQSTLLRQFKSGVLGTEELADGFIFSVPGEKEWMMLVSELLVNERECCPFLTFQVTAEPNMGPVRVRMSGPAGTKDLLKAMFCNSEGSL